MIGDIKGYCMMKCALDCVIGYNERFDPIGYHKIEAALNEGNNIYPIMDIAVDKDGLLIVNTQGAPCLIQVNSLDSVQAWFECDQHGEVLLPPGLNFAQQMVEFSKRIMRKGGYNDIIRKVVIITSLHKGKFTDDFLFSKEVCNEQL